MPSRIFRNLLAISAVFLFLVPSALHAQSGLGYRPVGQQPFDSGIRATGMGGAWLAAGNEPMVVHGNPALAAAFRHPGFGISMDLTRLDSRTSHQGNQSSMYTPGEARPRTGSFLYPFGSPTQRMTAVLTWERVTHSNSTFIENEFYDSGFPYWVSGSFAFELTRGSSVGATIGYLGGGYEMSIEEHTPEQLFGTGRVITLGQTFSGLSVRFGYHVDLPKAGINLPLSLGMILRPGYTMQTTYHNPGHEDQDIEIDSPWLAGVGLAWRPMQNLEVGFDLERFMFQGTERRNEPSFYYPRRYPVVEHDTDMNGYRLGVEYTMGSGALLFQPRIGVNYLPTPYTGYDREYDETDWQDFEPVHSFGKTIGFGLRLGAVQLDVAYEHATSNYSQTIAYYYPYGESSIPATEYTVTTEQFLLGLAVWF
ncbi:hypothetical protein KQI63_09400 [bacterium]|nr:hypothetical protein [bacterium]